ncbi:MAG: hypothetical protein ACMXX5_01890 [Candidatus Woesearchaeota archaeon]
MYNSNPWMPDNEGPGYHNHKADGDNDMGYQSSQMQQDYKSQSGMYGSDSSQDESIAKAGYQSEDKDAQEESQDDAESEFDALVDDEIELYKQENSEEKGLNSIPKSSSNFFMNDELMQKHESTDRNSDKSSDEKQGSKKKKTSKEESIDEAIEKFISD